MIDSNEASKLSEEAKSKIKLHVNSKAIETINAIILTTCGKGKSRTRILWDTIFPSPHPNNTEENQRFLVEYLESKGYSVVWEDPDGITVIW